MWQLPRLSLSDALQRLPPASHQYTGMPWHRCHVGWYVSAHLYRISHPVSFKGHRRCEDSHVMSQQQIINIQPALRRSRVVWPFIPTGMVCQSLHINLVGKAGRIWVLTRDVRVHAVSRCLGCQRTPTLRSSYDWQYIRLSRLPVHHQ